MVKLLKMFFIAAFFITALFSPGFSQEQLTITTYYPSPYGSYRSLSIEGQLAAGQPAPGIYFKNNSYAPINQNHWMIREETNYLVFRDATEASWWGIAIDRNLNRIGFNNWGMVMAQNGNMGVRGDLLVKWDGNAGCITLSYGANSGIMDCPAGYTFSNTLNPATPSARGGVMYCCRTL